MSQTAGPDESGRRSFLQWVIRACSALIALITVIPGIGLLFAPLVAGANRQRRKVLFRNPADADSPTFVAARFEGQEETALGIFVRKVGDKAQVVSARCTHAGCAVTWMADKKQFVCPCHNGHFDENGNVLSGPPPRPLDRLTSEPVNGDLYIVEEES